MSVFTKVSAQDKANFANNLAVMLKSGIPINNALASLMADTNNKHLQTGIQSALVQIDNGQQLSEAFGGQPKTFDQLFVSLIKAGEDSGTLQESLTFLAEWLERSADLRREVSSATLYPKIIFSAALILGISLAVFILPRLAPLFSQLDVELPLITQWLLSFSLFLRESWLLTLILLLLLVVGVKLLLKLPKLKFVADWLVLRLPLVGHLFISYQLALISQLFSTLLRSGLPITETVEIVRKSIPNLNFQHSVKKMQETVESGQVMTKAMQRYPKLYPTMNISIIRVGEQSGTLADSFRYLADYHTKEVKTAAKRLPTIIEPVLLIFIAGVVGLVALSIVLPIYKLTGSIN